MVDFLLPVVLIELFLSVLQQRRYERISIENRRFCSNGVSLPQILGRPTRGPPTNYSSYWKTGINILSCGIKIWAELSFVLLQFTRLTNGRTDGRTDGRLPRG